MANAARLKQHWLLDPAVTFLNHGSFGACPRAVLAEQAALRERMEREPVRFFVRELEGLLDGARAALADFVGSSPEELAFVPNATAGVNAVLRSLDLAPGDELLVTDHEYRACRNALDYVAGRVGARVVVAAIPFPLRSPEDVVAAVLERLTTRTRLALLDHVTSQTAMVLPIERLVWELAARGVDTLVDGAHAPGMVDLDVRAVGAAYYTANCHKWMCAPKGAAFLHVRRDRQEAIHPVSISHGYSTPPAERSRFWLEFDWTGTRDPTAALCVPAAIRFLGALLPGGWAQVRAHNRSLVLSGRALVAATLGCEAPCPEAMVGSMAALPLPDGEPWPPRSPLYRDPLQDTLLERFGVQVPVIPWPDPPRRLLRISAQIYNERADYERLATALRELLGGPG